MVNLTIGTPPDVDFYNPNVDHPAVQEIAERVGRLCNLWARLEEDVLTLASALLEAPNDHVTEAMLRTASFGDHLSMIRIGIVGRRIDPRWSPLILSSIHYVDGALRPRRNRYVHDTWAADSDGQVYRLQRSHKIVKPQAKRPPRLTTVAVSLEDRAELDTCVEDVREHGLFLYTAACDLTWDHPPTRAQALNMEPPPQRLEVLADGFRPLSEKAGRDRL